MIELLIFLRSLMFLKGQVQVKNEKNRNNIVNDARGIEMSLYYDSRRTVLIDSLRRLCCRYDVTTSLKEVYITNTTDC